MISIQEGPTTKYQKNQSVKIMRGGHGIVVDIFTPEFDEPMYTVGFPDGIVMTFRESELLPYTNHDRGKDANSNHKSVVAELIAQFERDRLRLCSSQDRNAMRLITDYFYLWEIISIAERDALYNYLGIE